MTEHITLRPGRPTDAPQIARLIIMAMTDECCRHFYGPHHTAADFLSLITALAGRTDTQYSYLNTICATVSAPPAAAATSADADTIVGISVSYNGAHLYRLRQPFIDGALRLFGIDHSEMPPETQAGELYLDSLAVRPQYRGRGIATRLLRATAEKAAREGAGPLGLLVDTGNPRAERLYTSVGFSHVDSTTWGGHSMHHLQMKG